MMVARFQSDLPTTSIGSIISKIHHRNFKICGTDLNGAFSFFGPRHPKKSPPDDPLGSSHGKSPLRIPTSMASPWKEPH